MPRLPITGQEVDFAPATGYDDLVLVELGVSLAGALELCRQRTVPVRPQEPLDVSDLPVGDLDVLVLALRQAELGNWLVGEGACRRCGARVDVSFDLPSYLEHRRPRRPAAAEPDDEPGWWRLARHGVSCRPPTAADVIACAGQKGARRQLLDRCVRGERTSASEKAAERALAAVAPTLRSEVGGHCPECEEAVSMDFDARNFCLRELRDRAVSVLQDVVVLGGSCRWSETEILSLPSRRRSAYVELLGAAGVAMTLEASVA